MSSSDGFGAPAAPESALLTGFPALMFQSEVRGDGRPCAAAAEARLSPCGSPPSRPPMNCRSVALRLILKETETEESSIEELRQEHLAAPCRALCRPLEFA